MSALMLEPVAVVADNAEAAATCAAVAIAEHFGLHTVRMQSRTNPHYFAFRSPIGRLVFAVSFVITRTNDDRFQARPAAVENWVSLSTVCEIVEAEPIA